MTKIITTPYLPQSEIETTERLFDNWFDPIESSLRDRAREFLQAMFEAELDEVLARSRYARGARPASGDSGATPAVTGHRHGHRSRSLLGTFGKLEIAVPRARLNTSDGKTTEWRSGALRAYQRRTMAADALIAGCYLAGTNTRRVRRALIGLFGGAVGKDTVSRVWRKVKSDWDAWNARSLTEEPIVRLILDGTVVRVRLDRKATAISLLVVIGVRADGQKVLLAVKAMGGESTEAWRTVLDDLIRRGLRRPERRSPSPWVIRRASVLKSWRAPGWRAASIACPPSSPSAMRPRSPPCGTAFRCSAARSTSIATCWRMRPSACTRRSPPTTTT